MEKSEQQSSPATSVSPGEVVFCASCGAKNTAGDKFCSECGKPLEASTDGISGEGVAAGPSRKKLFLLLAGVLAVGLVVVLYFARGSKVETASKAENECHDLKVEGDVVWVGTTGGVVEYDRKKGKTLAVLKSKDGLCNDFVESVYVDKQGRKWFGTLGGGISLYDGKNWLKYDPITTKGGFNDTGLHAIIQDSKGLYWIASANSGVYSFDGMAWANYGIKDGLPSRVEDKKEKGLEVNWLEEDHDGTIWACTNAGVAQFNPEGWGKGKKRLKWRGFTPKDGLVNAQVWCAVVDRLGVKWFGTWGGGISKFDGTSWTTVPAGDKGPSSPYVFASRIDSDGNLWFGTYDGVSMWDGAKWTYFKRQQGLLGTDVYDVEIDQDGNKWFCTYKGVSRLDKENKKWKTMSQ